MREFLRALTYPFRGIDYFLKRPPLWKYAIGAVAINLLLFILLAYLFLHYREAFIGGITPARFPTWLRTALAWILTGVVAIAGIFLFTLVGNLLATPFLDALTQKILTELGEALPPARGALGALRRGLVNQTLKLIFFGSIQALLLLLWATPLGILHPPLSAFLAVLFLGFEYLDYPLDARGVPVPERFTWLFRNLGSGLGFGLVVFGAMWVPLLGYLSLPLAVSGAALLAHRIDSPPPKR